MKITPVRTSVSGLAPLNKRSVGFSKKFVGQTEFRKNLRILLLRGVHELISALDTLAVPFGYLQYQNKSIDSGLVLIPTHYFIF